MLPDEVFKRRRRHNNTPESLLLIIANFIVVTLNITLFASGKQVHWFFWVVIGLLAIYNAYTIHRYRDEYNKPAVIAYIISMLALIGLFFILKGKS